MTVKRPCLDCRRPTGNGARCPDCAAERDRARGTRQERGYGADHDKARRAIAARLPLPCLYCHGQIDPGDRWDAAHVLDGHPEYGTAPAHPRCNQRARADRAPGDDGRGAS